MTPDSALLLLGFGSPHGDDQAGWEVVRQVAARWELAGEAASPLTCRALQTPLELLDHLPITARLLICDACLTSDAIGRIYRWTWPHADWQHARWGNTHGIDLPGALQLAATLGLLPDEVEIRAIGIGHASRAGKLSPAVRAAVAALAAEIVRRPRGGNADR